MNFFREETPRAVDWEGCPLTESQVRLINHYLDRVASGIYSQSYLQELRDVANQSFQRAVRDNSREIMDRVGTELQVIDHVLNTVFKSRTKISEVRPDPKHLEYLAYLEEQARMPAHEEVEEPEFESEFESEFKAEPDFSPEVATEAEIEAEPAALVVPGLSQDVISAFFPRSTIPEISAIQQRLERLVYEYHDDVMEGQPDFITRPTLRKIAKVHEELEATKGRYGQQKLFRRANPYY